MIYFYIWVCVLYVNIMALYLNEIIYAQYTNRHIPFNFTDPWEDIN